MPTVPATFSLPFVKKIQHTSDTYSLYFDRTQYQFEFAPGQYVRVVLPHDNPDERGTSRFFTIASSPLDDQYLVITTKMMQSTFKHSMLQLLPGQTVQFWGPLGLFTLDENDTRPVVLLAGGIGMTPFYSMIAYAFQKQLQRPITLLVSFSSHEEFVYYHELMEIAQKVPTIHVVYSVTRTDPSAWSGEKGRINEAMVRKYVSSLKENVYYICGPRIMVEETEALLLSLGISDEQIHIEKFTGYVTI